MKREIKKIKYERYLTGDTHVHIQDGNRKLGKGIYSINLLAGDKPLTKKDGTPTGDKRVIINTLGYEGTIVPVKLELPQALVQPFLSMGYYEGVVTTLWGKVINTRKEEVVTEQAGFGESNTKIVTTIVSKNEITGGKPPYTLNEIGYTQEDYEQAKAKRKMKLDSILSNATNNNSTNSTTNESNPFANQQGATYNPFAQQ